MATERANGTTGSPASDDRLLPLADYNAPGAPAHDLLERLQTRVRHLFNRERQAAVQDARLKRAQHDELTDYIAVPDCHLVVDELEGALLQWSLDASDEQRLRVVVLPPCERSDVIGALAERHALECLQPPPREALRERRSVRLPSLDAERLLVVPRLERWFLRSRHGLHLVRELLQTLSQGPGRCLIGVDAWAWHYLVSAARADLLLPAPTTLRPFDADRLAEWFAELAQHEGTAAVTLLTAKDGADIFARNDDDELSDDYLRELASRSLGIPWVAWQMWRRGLRTLPTDPESECDPDPDMGDDADDAAPPAQHDDDDTLWVTHDAAPLLPIGHEHGARLVLHAVLLHGALGTADLVHVLPSLIDVPELVRALQRAAVLAHHDADDTWYVLPSAYPTVRTSLSEAGFSMAAL